MNIVKSVQLIVLLLLGAISVVNAKPLPSVTVQMQWQAGLEFEQSNVIQISVLSFVSASDLQLQVSLPNGVSMLNGQTNYSLNMEKGKRKELLLEVYVDKSATGSIKAEARLGKTGDALFYAADMLPILSPQLNQSLKARSVAEPGYRQTQRNGIKLREYRLSQ